MPKQTVEGWNFIDIKDWAVTPEPARSWSWPDGTSVSGEIQKFQIVMRYQYRETYGKEESIEEVIPIDWTLSRLGREKYWFQCPGCGMRAAVLFVAKYFRCRRCLGLVYQSQKQTPPGAGAEPNPEKTHEAGRQLRPAGFVPAKTDGHALVNLFPQEG